MSKPLLVLVAVVSLASHQAAAQSSGSSTTGGPVDWPRNVLLVNPGDLFNGLVTLEYERGVTSLLGIEVGMSVLAFRGVFDPPVKAHVIAVAPELGVRFHFIRNAPGGLWIGPSINAAYIAPASSDTPPRAFGFGFGAAVGYNFILRNFVLQLGVGGAVHDYGEGFVWSPRFRLGIGAAF